MEANSRNHHVGRQRSVTADEYHLDLYELDPPLRDRGQFVEIKVIFIGIGRSFIEARLVDKLVQICQPAIR